MSKLTLTDFSNLQNNSTVVTLLNANNAAVTTAVENTLSRDGTSPNQMSANLDMNGFAILNASIEGAREALLEDRTYYVSTTGDDSNTGLTAADPFLTIQTAVSTAFGLDLNGFNLTIQLADGTYTGSVGIFASLVGFNGNNGFTIQGNSSTPGNVIVTADDDYTFDVQEYADVHIKDLEIRNTGFLGCVAAFNNAIVRVGNVRFGTCTGGDHIISAGFASVFALSSGYSIVGNAAFHFHSTTYGHIGVNQTITLSGTPAFSTFAYVEDGGSVLLSNGTSFSGSATGQRYHVDTNGLIFIENSVSGFGTDTTIPGDAAGAVTSGGVYQGLTGRLATMTLSNGTNNNVTTTAPQDLYRIAGPTGSFAITGILRSGENSGIPGRTTVHNPTVQTMTIHNQSASSTASNRITTNTGASVAITGPGVADFYYSPTDTAWILTGHQP